jgi:hypothetical protein
MEENKLEGHNAVIFFDMNGIITKLIPPKSFRTPCVSHNPYIVYTCFWSILPSSNRWLKLGIQSPKQSDQT